jgi:hypothetical protein
MSDMMTVEKIKRPRIAKGIVVADYKNYNINYIYTNEAGNRIYFKDTTDATYGRTIAHNDLPCFYFDFKEGDLFMEGGVKAGITVTRQITNGLRDISKIALSSNAPFWVVSYLCMILNHLPYSIRMFYNAFAYKNGFPHPDINSRKVIAESISKAGFCLNLSYLPYKDKWQDDLKKALVTTRKNTDMWTDPYSVKYSVSYTGAIDSFIVKSKMLGNEYFQNFANESRRFNKDYTKMILDYSGYGLETFLQNLEVLKGFGYDYKRLAKYLTTDIDYQGINPTFNPRDTLELLKDYARMTNAVLGNNKFIKYPAYLKTFHDIAQKNYKAVEEKVDQEKFEVIKQETIDKLPEFKVPHKKFTILVPNTMKEIIQEGARMHHCVASYAKTMANKQTTILFMRKKEEIEESLITIEVKNLFSEYGDTFVNQARGHSNRTLNEDEIEFLILWTKRNKVAYQKV